MDKKVAVYICRGCEIGESLNVEELVELATGDCGADLCRDHEFLCGESGLEQIQADIQENSWGRTINISDPDGNRVGVRDEAGFVHQITA